MLLPWVTVLGPLMFLSCINDIVVWVSSPLYTHLQMIDFYIKQVRHSLILKNISLGLLFQWATVWQIRFNLFIMHTDYDQMLQVVNTFQHNYQLDGQVLDTRWTSTFRHPTTQIIFLWSGHITKLMNKASQIVIFLRWNLNKCSSTVKAFLILL